MTISLRAREVRFEEAARVRGGRPHDLFGRAGGDDVAAQVAAFGAEVNDVVGGFYHVEVVLDDEERAARFDQSAEGGEQLVDVVEVEARGRLVEDVERARAGALREIGGELDALRFAARKRCGRLAEAEVAEAHVVEDAQAVTDLRGVAEKRHRLAHGHVEHVVDVLSSVAYVQDLRLEARALALLADQFHVGEELHLDRHRAVALAHVAAPARHVEGEVRGVEALRLRVARLREDLADGVVGLDVGDRVRARRATDGRLVNEYNVVYVLRARKLSERADVALPLAPLLLQAREDDIVDER